MQRKAEEEEVQAKEEEEVQAKKNKSSSKTSGIEKEKLRRYWWRY